MKLPDANPIRVTKPELTAVIISPQDVKIVQGLAWGHRAFDIAPELELSARTVEAHIDKLKNKVGAKTQGHLIAIFFREGLIK